MTPKEIRAEIKDIKRQMKDAGIRERSCFNAGHTLESYRLNCAMFRLKTELKNASK